MIDQVRLPKVERDTEVDDGDPDIYKGGNDGEDQVLEQVVDGAGASVHDSQHFPRLWREGEEDFSERPKLFKQMVV